MLELDFYKNTTILISTMKLTKNQILLPSGVAVSKDGKYHYWACSVSGFKTFAKPDYWIKIMAKFGSEENLVKTYICKKAQNLLNIGLSREEIRNRLSKLNTVPEKEERKKQKEEKVQRQKAIKEERKEQKAEKVRRKELVKKPRKKGLKSFAVGKDEVLVQTDTGSLVKEVVPVYPWQGDPNYFRGGPPRPMSIEEATKDSCMFPRRNIDDNCQGCPVYERCTCYIKVDSAEWLKPRTKHEVVIKPLPAFDDVLT